MHRSRAPWFALLLFAWAAGSSGCFGREEKKDNRYNLVLISIDTLRADHLGCYGYARKSSPNVDAFARESVLFENAFSHSPDTTSSHMTIFTSLQPTVHGVFMYLGPQEAIPFRLDDKITTLAEHLRKQGYLNAAFTGGGHVSNAYGFDKGFDAGYATDDKWESGLAWLRKNRREPFFAFFHTYAVHDPYQPPDPYYGMFSSGYAGKIRRVGEEAWWKLHEDYWRNVNPEDPEDVKQLMALYDGAIRYMDEKRFKPLIDTLASLGLRDRTIVVFTSDHGEEFKEHGGLLHKQLYDETLHVPLLISLPAGLSKRFGRAGRIRAEVGLIDLMPTLLGLLGTPFDGTRIQGRSLEPYLEGRVKEGRPIYAARVYGHAGPPADLIGQSLRDRGRKLIEKRHRSGPARELYDLALDRSEQRDLAAADPGGLFEMTRRLLEAESGNRRFRERLSIRPTGSAYDQAALQRLKALGYVQ